MTDESFDAFLDDYFAECDEHLTTARRALLALEGAGGSAAVERPLVEELFRIYHSIKGISGMVELRPAEQLAHDLESYLRALRQRETLLSPSGIDTLIDGTQRLEQVIAARRHGTPSPSTEDVRVAVAQLLRVPGPSARETRHSRDSDTVPAAARHVRVLFRPSADLSARGIGVDAVRKRLSALGDILDATPNVGPDGRIEFSFRLVTTADDAAFGSLQDTDATVEITDPVADAQAPIAVEAGATGRTVAPSHFVRVDLTRLDELMRTVGDLVISRARLVDSLERIEPHVPAREWRAVQENATAIDRQLRSLRERIMRVRLVPVGEIFRRMPFVVRDLARSFGKAVDLQLVGQETEIDKYLIERMMDPVLHLVRNAISHGIESPDVRMAVGKSPTGTITLRAFTSGDQVTIEVADDGRGIDDESVVARAREADLPLPAGRLDSAALLALICAPGFSTRDESDRASGRGVGMAVVKSTVEELSGVLGLETRPGEGTRFTVQLPLTLAVTDALVAHVGGETFAVPQGAVREVLELDEADVRPIEQNEIVPHRGGALPLVRLAALFGLEAAARLRRHVLVTGVGSAAVGFVVDRIVGQREVVVRPIGDALAKVDGISGATDLGDGRVVLILDPAALGRLSKARAEARRA